MKIMYNLLLNRHLFRLCVLWLDRTYTYIHVITYIDKLGWNTINVILYSNRFLYLE